MSKDEKLDLLVKKVKRGIILSSKKFLKEAKEQNQKLVIMRNNRVVTIPARELK
ncbi:MAG TPA: hypothetical protein VG603_06380 [Chitinophagales bacterium]|nr:hypothetical protein [Chitinophagales bacterium]